MADLEHVAAVERPRQLDALHGETEGLDCRRDRRKLATARLRTRRRQHREVTEDDEGILDEDPVGVLVGRLDLDDVPAVGGKRIDVGMPLRERKIRIDRHSADVRQLAGGESRGGAANEDAAAFKGFSAAMMIAALAFTALVTAGLVNRLVDRRLCAIFGRRCLPRANHVVVVGLGQVGLRLCLLLRELDIPVVAIESNPDADYVTRAENYGIPVVIGSAAVASCCAPCPCGARARRGHSDEVENIAIVAAAHGEHETLRTLLRAGRGEFRNETRALLKLGVVRDVYRMGGTLLAAAALGSKAREAVNRSAAFGRSSWLTLKLTVWRSSA